MAIWPEHFGEISFRQLVNAKICLLFFGREEIDLFVDYGAQDI